MRKDVLWRKISRIILLLADSLNTTPQRALAIFYETQTCARLHDERYGLHLQSDLYILHDLLDEIRM